MLNDDADEPFQRTENRAVNHDRTVLGVIGADVRQLEVLRLGVVELYGAELPRTADGIGDVEVELRTVERAVAGVDVIRQAMFLQRLLQSAFGGVPHRIRSHSLVGARG